jgi:sialate O-acetylesterase
MLFRKAITGILLVACFVSAAQANVKLPAIFSDHMVLQQGVRVPVWGWAEPGEKVTVAVAGQKVTTTTGADGKWMVKLEPLKASAESMEMVVESSEASRLTFHDVIVGEVWVCSGQSNMAWPLSATFSAPEIPKANYPQIRIFKVGYKPAYEPQTDCEGKWVLCTPETAATFSGVGYFFGRELHQALHTPVGMIGSYCNGTPAQAWTSLDGLRSAVALKEYVDSLEKLSANRAQIEEEYANKYLPDYESRLKRWKEEYQAPHELALRQWTPEVAKARKDGKPLPPKPELKQAAPPKYECRTRRGDNPTVLNNGMVAPLIPYAIKGVIWYQGESNCHNPIQYRTLFPALINDWRRMWGQPPSSGSGVPRGDPSAGSGRDFPFLFVQLCSGAGEGDRLPLMREAQASALSLPNTGMAVILDCGEPKNPQLHPRNKRDVGGRLALLARKVAYGQKVVASGPVFRDMKVEGGKVRLSFDSVGGGLVIGAPPKALPTDEPNVPDSNLLGFSIAGSDQKFVPAQARIDGTNVLVWSDQINVPVAVRYAWRSDPFEANLYNKEQLPAAPFRTDDWRTK